VLNKSGYSTPGLPAVHIVLIALAALVASSLLFVFCSALKAQAAIQEVERITRDQPPASGIRDYEDKELVLHVSRGVSGIEKVETSRLDTAAREGAMHNLTALILSGADPNAHVSGRRPLGRALKNLHLDAAIFLMNNGADPSLEDDSEPILMCMADSFGGVLFAKALTHVPDTPRANSVLREVQKHLLSGRGVSRLSKLRALADHGKVYTDSALSGVPLSAEGDSASTTWLKSLAPRIDYGASRFAPPPAGADVTASWEGETALHIAAECAHIPAIHALVDHGISPDTEDLLGDSPVFWAVREQRWDSVLTLIELGADADKLNRHGQSLGLIVMFARRRSDSAELMKLDSLLD